ncbi:MAG TPA: hypothetical protein VGM76_05525 [Lacipirellulaceae bacterium]|jgi:hypothetical protein
MNRIRGIRFALLIGAVLVFASAAHACPTCGEGLMQADPHAQSIAAGFKYSILFMLSMPYICLGTLCSIAYYSIRRANAQQAAAGESADEPASV